MLASLIATIALGQTRLSDLPKLVYDMPVLGGQREIVLGAKPYEFTLLNGYLEREVSARHLTTPSNTGDGYVDSWQPGGTHEESLGYFDCSTKPTTLFEKPCTIITTTAKWNQTIGRKPHEIKFQNLAKQQWWVSPDGVLMRHFSQLQNPNGVQTGDCTYGKDSIQRRYTGVDGKTVFGEIFPSCTMDEINARFKPMFENGKLILREKDFCVVDPLTGGVEKYHVRSSGRFKGNFLFATFQGQLFDIEGPNHFSQKVFLDDKGDLVKVQLDEERFFVISVVPTSHLDEYGRPVRSGGG
jgi:hypothetical protein